MTDEEKKAAEEAAAKKAAEEAEAAAAAEAARKLAKRRHEADPEDDDAPVRMRDLHDVTSWVRGELAKGARAEPVPHAVPDAPRADAQGRKGGVLSGVLGGAVVVLVLLGLAVFAERKGAGR